MRRTLSPTRRKKLDWVTTICTLTGTGLPLNPSIKVKTSCPPSNNGKGNELRTAKLIEIKAHNVKTIDTTGAGDTFIGYYVAGVASKMNKKDNLERASMAAAITTTKLGGAESIPRIN